jgi:hypothetical protein
MHGVSSIEGNVIVALGGLKVIRTQVLLGVEMRELSKFRIVEEAESTASSGFSGHQQAPNPHWGFFGGGGRGVARDVGRIGFCHYISVWGHEAIDLHQPALGYATQHD